MTKQQHRRSSAMTLFLAFASGLVAVQFVKLVGITAGTGSTTPGRTFLLSLTLLAGVAAAVGLVTTTRATRRLLGVRPIAG